MVRIQPVLAAALLLAAAAPVAFAVQAEPINDLSATVIGSAVEFTMTLPDGVDGTLFSALEIRQSTVKPIESDADWDGAEVTVRLDDPAALTPGGVLTCMSGDLPAGSYWFVARVKNDKGWSKIAADFLPPVTIGGSVVVPPVTGLGVMPGTATATTLRLTWNALSGSAVQLRIFYSTSPSVEPMTPATDWISGMPAQATVTLPASAATYYFGAKARNAAGEESAMSASPHPGGTTLAGPGGPDPGIVGGGSSTSSCGHAASGSAVAWILAFAVIAARR